VQPSVTQAPDLQRANVVARIQPLVAESLDLYAAAKQAHWCTRGPAFIAVHELYDRVADAALDAYDTLAERIRALGSLPRGTVQTAVATSALPPMPEDLSEEPALQAALVERLTAYRTHLAAARDALEHTDPETFDDLVQIVKELEKLGWFLLSHVPEGLGAAAVSRKRAAFLRG
jgi:starvation-inducible DNA-binding protein